MTKSLRMFVWCLRGSFGICVLLILKFMSDPFNCGLSLCVYCLFSLLFQDHTSLLLCASCKLCVCARYFVQKTWSPPPGKPTESTSREGHAPPRFRLPDGMVESVWLTRRWVWASWLRFRLPFASNVLGSGWGAVFCGVWGLTDQIQRSLCDGFPVVGVLPVLQFAPSLLGF